MLLKSKIAIVHGAGGAIGSTVAKTFAAEGARVFLAGRTRSKLDAAANAIVRAGGNADVAEVDAMDQLQVEEHADGVVERAGRIDVTINAVGVMHVQGVPFLELGYDEYAEPLHGVARTNFLTAKAAARHMVKRGSGVILTVSTPGSVMAAGGGYMGYGAACATVEAMTRHLSGELGPSGVRAVCLRSQAMPETLARDSYTKEVFGKVAAKHGTTAEAMLAENAKIGSLLGRFPSLQQFADTAAFMASDRAGAVTAAIVNLTCGSVVD